MTSKGKGHAPNVASSNAKGNLTCKKANTGYLDSQRKEEYTGPAIDPAILRTLKIHVRALERANRDWRAAGNCPIDFKLVRGKWVAYKDPSLQTMGEAVEREGRRALLYWKGIPVPKYQPQSEWDHAMTDEIDPSFLKFLEDGDWSAVALAIQSVKCELKLVCASTEWDRPGGEWRANQKMALLLEAAKSEVAHA